MDNLKQEKPIEYHDIILTDIQLHTIRPRKPESWYRAFWRSIKNKLPGRVYSRDISIKKNGTMIMGFPLPNNLQKEAEKAERSGKKLRIFMPTKGIPIMYGSDLIDRLKAKQDISNTKTRVWRAEP